MSKLHDDEKLFLDSVDGIAVFRLFLPLLRAIALYVTGRSLVPPPELGSLPELKSDVELEKARQRALKSKG